MTGIKKKKPNLEDEIDELYEYDADCDLPIHETVSKQKKIRHTKGLK